MNQDWHTITYMLVVEFLLPGVWTADFTSLLWFRDDKIRKYSHGIIQVDKISREISEEYLILITKFQLKPIESAEHNRQALEVLNELIIRDNQNELSPDELGYLRELANLIKEFEKIYNTSKASTRREILLFLLDIVLSALPPILSYSKINCRDDRRHQSFITELTFSCSGL
jgi:hypothetical protein